MLRKYLVSPGRVKTLLTANVWTNLERRSRDGTPKAVRL